MQKENQPKLFKNFPQPNENKIISLEKRILGPNNAGQPPTEYHPLKKEDLQGIKNQMTIKNIKNVMNQKNISSSKKFRKKSNFIELKIEMFLQKKRNYKNEDNENYIKSDSINNNMSNNTGNSCSGNSNISQQSVLSSKSKKEKNINKNLNNSFRNSYKTKSIKDYYQPTSVTRSYSKPNKSFYNSKKKPYTKLFDNKIFNSYDYDFSETDCTYNSNNLNAEKLLQKIENNQTLLENKDKEISLLKSELENNEKIIQDLKEIQSNSDIEIKKCRLDICNMVKEIAILKRENKKKWLNEQEYTLGNFSKSLSFNSNVEYWEDGISFKQIKQKLNNLKNEKEQLEKLISSKKNNIDNDTLEFKLKYMQRMENDLKTEKTKLDIQRSNFIHELNLYNQESKCIFGQKKEGSYPLLSGRYQIISLLGKGGFSEVYKAYDLENHIYVACKLNQINSNWKEEIRNSYIKHTVRENSIQKKISHPKIVQYYDTIEIDNNSFCTILEYCTGPDLAQFLRQNKNIQEKEAKLIIKQILEGLIYLNELPQKIIHYDLKLENIIFNNMEVKISDFGLSKIIEDNTDKVQLTSQGVGTYWYLPPECFENKKNIKISSKVDIWSCGVILYEMLFNQKPFGQNYSQEKLIKDKIMQNAKNVEFPDEPKISEECKNFIKKCLAYNQEDRYDVFEAINSPFINNKNEEL